MDREDWNLRYAGREFVWSVEANRFLVEQVDGLAPGRALDVAAGEGRNAVWLAERGWEVDAVDFADAGLAKAGRLARARGVRVRWIHADLLEFAPQTGRYDLVIVFYLHLPWGDMREVLRRSSRAVATGGTFLLVGHDRTNLERGHGGPRSPAVLYTPEMVAAELSDLTPVEVARRQRTVETEAGVATAIDCLVRATAVQGGAAAAP